MTPSLARAAALKPKAVSLGNADVDLLETALRARGK